MHDSVYTFNQHVVYIFHRSKIGSRHSIQLDSKIRALLALDHDRILLSAENGLIELNPLNRQYHYVKSIPDNEAIAGVVQSPLFPGSFVAVSKSGMIYLLDNRLKICKKQMQDLKGITVKQVITDDRGNIWIASNRGIFRINQALNISTIDKFHGFPTDLINHISFGNKMAFVSTEEGLVIFPANKSFFNAYSPDLYATTLTVNGRLQQLNNAHTLRYDENYLRIGFQGLNFMSGSHIIYHYRMEGIDDKWHSTGNNHVEFAGLQPGNYIFTVYATNPDGVKSRQTVRIHFTIYPPFWKTWWFFTLASCFVVSLTILFFYVRIKQIKKRELEKNELMRKIGLTEMQALRSQMNPHFIFNSMNSIQHYVLSNDPLNANKYLSKFSKLMRNVLEHSRLEQVSLEQELETIRTYLEIESLRFEDKFSWHIQLAANVVPEMLFVPPMIIQPFIENALWHGLMAQKGEQKLIVNIYTGSEQLCIEVEDNGVGREASTQFNAGRKKNESLGMKITKERLDLLENFHNVKAEAVIVDKFKTDNTSGGTKAIVKIPLLKT